jgi:hypothetical protein
MPSQHRVYFAAPNTGKKFAQAVAVTAGSPRRPDSDRGGRSPGPRPASRRARRWQNSSQHWSSATSTLLRRAASSTERPAPARSSACSSSTNSPGAIRRAVLCRLPCLPGRTRRCRRGRIGALRQERRGGRAHARPWPAGPHGSTARGPPGIRRSAAPADRTARRQDAAHG